MSYKYHERAMVLNERNLIKLWDICFAGYNGGMDRRIVNWRGGGCDSVDAFATATEKLNCPYDGPSIMVMRFKHLQGRNKTYSNPLVFKHSDEQLNPRIDPDNVHRCYDPSMQLWSGGAPSEANNIPRWQQYSALMPSFDALHHHRQAAGQNATSQTTEVPGLAFQGSSRVVKHGMTLNKGEQNEKIIPPSETIQNGAGHLGASYVGVASVREGKGMFFNSRPFGSGTQVQVM